MRYYIYAQIIFWKRSQDKEAKVRDRIDLEVNKIGINIGKGSFFRNSQHLCELSDRTPTTLQGGGVRQDQHILSPGGPSTRDVRDKSERPFSGENKDTTYAGHGRELSCDIGMQLLRKR